MGRFVEKTLVSSVQFFGQRSGWPDHVVYVGMPGPAARAYGITDDIAGPFGKPWACLDAPDGWANAYHRYLIARITSDKYFADAVKNLHGKTLLCWCAAKEQRRGTPVACHARILAQVVDILNS